MIVVVFLHQRGQMYKKFLGNEDEDVAIDILYSVSISKLSIDDH